MNINDPNRPVILFIPEAGIYPFTRGLAVLGDAVVRNGGKVFITHDTGQMLRSPIMAMYKTSVDLSLKEKLKIRMVTERYFNAVIKKYGFSSIELSDFIDKKLMAEINSLVNRPDKNYKKINYRDFPVGKMAEFDFILETKFPYYSNLSGLHKKLYLQYVKNTALALAVTDKICEQYRPSLILTFNEYAQCQAVRYSAEKHNIRHMAITNPVHFNIDTSRLQMWEFTYRHWIADHIRKWKDWRNFPVTMRDVAASWDDSVFRGYSSGSHIFSSRKEKDPVIIFEKLKLDKKRKTIVVYTSSQEERRCAGIVMKVWGESDYAIDAFSSHTEWLSMLRDYASKRDDIQIVVRVHPREGFRQFGFDSEHLRKLKAEFKKNTPNFIMVWPNDPISSYDLMELADVCLIAWSTIGQEAARLGVPVLSCVTNMYYPDDDFIQTASTRGEYKKKLDAILKMDYKWQHLAKAIRFYHWRTFIPSLDLGKSIPSDFDDRALWPKVSAPMMKTINNILSGKQNLIAYNIKEWKASLPKNADNKEKMALKRNIRFFLDKIFYPPAKTGMAFRLWRYAWRKITRNSLWVPKRHFKDYRLIYSENKSLMKKFIRQTKNDPSLRILLADGLQATLIYKGRMLHRMSPMAIRLARLHEYN